MLNVTEQKRFKKYLEKHYVKPSKNGIETLKKVRSEILSTTGHPMYIKAVCLEFLGWMINDHEKNKPQKITLK